MTSNHRKQEKEKTREKTNAGKRFHLCPAHPSSKAQNNCFWGLQFAHGMQQGRVISVPKAFCKPGWKLRLGLFLSPSALTATTTLISNGQERYGRTSFSKFSAPSTLVIRPPAFLSGGGWQNSKPHSVSPFWDKRPLGSNPSDDKNPTLWLCRSEAALSAERR